jgi:hypothetical protein
MHDVGYNVEMASRILGMAASKGGGKEGDGIYKFFIA